MSAKPDAGFVKEASRQILAGGSAGKVAPPRPAPPRASCFFLRVSRKLSSDESPYRSFSPEFCAAGVAPEPAERESKGGRERTADAGCPRSSPRRRRSPAPRLPCPSLESERGSPKACNLEEAFMRSGLLCLRGSGFCQT